jgi:putative hemolysin
VTTAELTLTQQAVSRFSPSAFTLAVNRALPALRACGGFRIPEAQVTLAAPTLGSLGPLGIRLAAGAKEVRLAQRLRYRVFYEEKSAVPNALTALARRDIDSYDPICDHLLVCDDDSDPDGKSGSPTVVGTYRLLRQQIAQRHGGFYSANEFDLSRLLTRQADLNFLELGRSCVLAGYRNKRTIELLWRGIWQYLAHHKCDVMIGCASFDGTDVDKLALPLSFLHHFASAPEEWKASALPERYVEMNRIPKEHIDAKAAIRELPPLIAGYLRIGAFVGRGAVIDHQFGTTDIFMIMPVASINPRYIAYFGSATDLRAA